MVLIIQPIRYVIRRKRIGSFGNIKMRERRERKSGNLVRNKRDALPVRKPRINVLLRQRLSGSKCG